ncbi:MAG: tRNA (N(6)-L-threonylcarbamoyladenosine(37)-C(2))-methylthiotransferase MtaB [Pelolinea sp.]|nr:tRNA (N(6)-L-threonylcarbamoyladenosine(37)-C(2))-methylthiotransferase MtaB [Pelolinea sp.]
MKVFLDSIGCRLNQSEIEKLAAHFREEGHEMVADAAAADLVVVNTCAVTAAASADSRNKIRGAARVGKARIVATGCYATIDPQAITKLHAVDFLVPNAEKNHLVSLVLGIQDMNPVAHFSRQPLPGNHKRTRAFIKVQDGCDNFCTFCITRIARGSSRSQLEMEIFEDISSALGGGAKEIVLSGVNLGAWGKEMEPQKTLAYLIKKIVERFSPPRIRLSSLEPWDIDDEFLDVLSLPGFCQHLHLPLQSGSDAVLKCMIRRSSTGDFESVVYRLRQSFPDIAITTDVMVGFPGEIEREFNASLEFVRNMEFAGGHVFSYSTRPGTAAEKLQDQIPTHIKKLRSAEMRDVIAQSAIGYRERFIGKELSVLWEKSNPSNGYWRLSGLTDNYLRVESTSKQDLYNKITQAEIINLNGLVMQAKSNILSE